MGQPEAKVGSADRSDEAVSDEAIPDLATADQTAAGHGGRLSSEHLPDLPIGVEQLVGPPPPAALIVGQLDRRQLCATLDRLGCAYVDLDEADFFNGAESLGAYHFVFVAAERLAHEEGVNEIRELHARTPNAKVILQCSGAEMSPGLLVEAMRAGVSDVVDSEDPIALSASISTVLRKAEDRADRVLAIGAHPDDVEIGCAGTLLEHRRQGDAVSILTLSRGDVGGDRNDRVLESTATAVRMGAQLMLGDLPDTQLDPGVETIRMIEAIVRLVDPTIIYVHSKHDLHQDHRAVHTAVVSASRGVPQVYAFQSPSATNDFAPTKFVAIDDVVVRKVEVLSLFDSQRDRSYLEPDLVIAGARYWARNLAPRARYAEPFEVIRSLTRSHRPAPATRTADQVPATGRPSASAAPGRGRSAVDA